MKYTDYLRELNNLENDYLHKKRELHIRFAKENNPVNVGDIIVDVHGDMIKVEEIKIGISTADRKPICRYIGGRYTKKMQPYKNGERLVIFQTNMVEKVKDGTKRIPA